MPYRFKEARLQDGLTTVQLAQKMGVTQAAVSQWDSGKKVPGIETVSRLADLYGVTVDYLLGRVNVPGNIVIPTERLDTSTLPILHGKPVWDPQYGWGIANAIQKNVVFMEGQKIPFEELNGLSVLPPAFTVGYHPYGSPVAHEDLKNIRSSGSNRFSQTHFRVMNYVAGIKSILSMQKMSMVQDSCSILMDLSGLHLNKNYNNRRQ